MPDPVDVCVVGSGAGGAPVAWELARSGLRIVVLEKGPHLTAADFVHDEIGTCRRDFFVPMPADDPHVVVREGQEPRATNEGWIASCVGGGTVHMSGFFFRMHPSDFMQRTLHGGLAEAELADWPISYRDLEPFYDEVESIIGLSDGGKNPFEPRRRRPSIRPRRWSRARRGAWACTRFRPAAPCCRGRIAVGRPAPIAPFAAATAARSTPRAMCA
jgi:choline dehydrogenase-like flavoprotein